MDVRLGKFPTGPDSKGQVWGTQVHVSNVWMHLASELILSRMHTVINDGYERSSQPSRITVETHVKPLLHFSSYVVKPMSQCVRCGAANNTQG